MRFRFFGEVSGNPGGDHINIVWPLQDGFITNLEENLAAANLYLAQYSAALRMIDAQERVRALFPAITG